MNSKRNTAGKTGRIADLFQDYDSLVGSIEQLSINLKSDLSTLDKKIEDESAARTLANTNLQTKITMNSDALEALAGFSPDDLATLKTSLEEKIDDLEDEIDEKGSAIASNKTDIAATDSLLSTTISDLSNVESQLQGLVSRVDILQSITNPLMIDTLQVSETYSLTPQNIRANSNSVRGDYAAELKLQISVGGVGNMLCVLTSVTYSIIASNIRRGTTPYPGGATGRWNSRTSYPYLTFTTGYGWSASVPILISFDFSKEITTDYGDTRGSPYIVNTSNGMTLTPTRAQLTKSNSRGSLRIAGNIAFNYQVPANSRTIASEGAMVKGSVTSDTLLLIPAA